MIAPLRARLEEFRNDPAELERILAAGQADIIDASGPAAAQAFPGGNGGKLIAAAANGFFGWTVIARNGGPQSIRELSGKMIGIISHVEALKERIPAQIRVVKGGGVGHSRLVV